MYRIICGQFEWLAVYSEKREPLFFSGNDYYASQPCF